MRERPEETEAWGTAVSGEEREGQAWWRGAEWGRKRERERERVERSEGGG